MKKIEKNCLIEGILKDLCTKHDVLYQKFGSAYMLCKWCGDTYLSKVGEVYASSQIVYWVLLKEFGLEEKLEGK